jgi:hypothetical protein
MQAADALVSTLSWHEQWQAAGGLICLRTGDASSSCCQACCSADGCVRTEIKLNGDTGDISGQVLVLLLLLLLLLFPVLQHTLSSSSCCCLEVLVSRKVGAMPGPSLIQNDEGIQLSIKWLLGYVLLGQRGHSVCATGVESSGQEYTASPEVNKRKRRGAADADSRYWAVQLSRKGSCQLPTAHAAPTTAAAAAS